VGERRGAYRVLVENLRERHHLENPYIDRMKIQGWSFRKWYGGIDRIDLVQDSDRLLGLVIAVMNLQVPQNAGIFLTSWEPLSFPRRTLLHGVINEVFHIDLFLFFGIQHLFHLPYKG
jgi:hypothetical protein